MELDLKKENLIIRLRNILNENNIKLWLSPYFNDNQVNQEALKELAVKYSNCLKETVEPCHEMLLELQQKSLRRMEQREDFKAHGLATIRIKVSNRKVPMFTLQLKLTDTGEILKQNIVLKTGVHSEKLKMISNGKVLNNESSLQDQNVKHGGTVLALVLQNEVGCDILSETKEYHELVENIRKDLEILNSTQNISELYPLVTNQSGAELQLSAEDNKILVTALTFHEKGRSALKKKQYSLALLFFLEAENEFINCHSDILDKVDNYALLNLDIVWTFLHLQSLDYLRDAEAKLNLCEQMFFRCYGPNLERLYNIKGTTENERVLLVRLRLLKGILLYLQNFREECLNVFEEVENDIYKLKVDKNNVQLLCAMGYSSEEARLALRTTCNNVDAAVEYIIRHQEKKEAVWRNEQIKKNIYKFVNRHTCRNGSKINITLAEHLHNMGYTWLLATQALMNSDNEINAAITWIENFISGLQNNYPIDMIDAFKILEFSHPNVERILKRCSYELTGLCVHDLLSMKIGFADKLKNIGLNHRYPDDATTTNSDNWSSFKPSTSQSSTSSVEPLVGKIELSNNAISKEANKALTRLRKDISKFSEEYLDCDLESEEKILKLYKSFLS